MLNKLNSQRVMDFSPFLMLRISPFRTEQDPHDGTEASLWWIVHGNLAVSVPSEWRDLREASGKHGEGAASYKIWLVVWNMNFIFPYIGNNNPN